MDLVRDQPARFEPFRGQHIANGAGAGVYLGPVEPMLGCAAATLYVSERAASTEFTECDAAESYIR
jgi:hypothetical protein